MSKVFKWIDAKEQPYPTEVEQFENYQRNGNNEFLAVIKQKIRTKWRLHTVPVNLWNEDANHPQPYWTITGTDEEVVPIKWAMMPEPEE